MVEMKHFVLPSLVTPGTYTNKRIWKKTEGTARLTYPWATYTTNSVLETWHSDDLGAI